MKMSPEFLFPENVEGSNLWAFQLFLTKEFLAEIEGNIKYLNWEMREDGYG